MDGTNIEEIINYCEKVGVSRAEKIKFVESKVKQHTDNKSNANRDDKKSIAEVSERETRDIKSNSCRTCGNTELEKRRFIKSDTLADNYIETIIFCADCGEVYKTIILEQ